MRRTAASIVGVSLLAFALAACQARTVPIRAIAAADVKDYRVQAVEVVAGDPSVTGTILNRVDIALAEATAECATGSRPVILDARIDHYREAGTAATILVGDRTVLAGRIALRDPVTRRIVASSYIESAVGGGGVLGAVITEIGEGGLPDTFASDVCEKIWQVRPPGQAAPLDPVTGEPITSDDE
ncbi:MAG: hypothetical protein AAFY02_04770 [Pseudomonadota bacterium]